MLFLRFQPLLGRDRQQHQGPGQRHAPLQAELLGPVVDCRYATAGETTDALVDIAVNLRPWLFQQSLCSVGFEAQHHGVAGQLRGFFEDRVHRAELADGGAEQHDQVFFADQPAVRQRQHAVVLTVGQQALALFPLRRQACTGGREQVDTQLVFVQLDGLMLGALTHLLGAHLEPGQPVFGFQAFQQVGGRAADQAITVQGVFQQPARGDDVAALDQGHFRVQQLEREHQPHVVFQPFVLGHLAQAGQQLGGQAGLLGPGHDHPAQQVIQGLGPVLGFGGRQGKQPGFAKAPVAQGQGRAFGVVFFGGHGGGGADRLAVEPGLDLRPLPALVAIPGQQAAQQQVELRVQVLGQQHAVGEDMDQVGIGIDAGKAGALGQLFEQDHAQAPPVRRCSHAAGNRLGGHVAAGFQGRDDVQVELRQARRTEAADHQVQRFAAAHQQGRRAQVAVAQAGFAEGMQGLAQLAHDVLHRAHVVDHHTQLGQGAAGEFFGHLIGAFVPAPGGDDFRHVLAGQALEHFVHCRVRFGAGLVQGQHRLAGAVQLLGHKPFAHPGAADLTQQAPAIDHGFAAGGSRFCDRRRHGVDGGWRGAGRVGAAFQAHDVAGVHGVPGGAVQANGRGVQ